MRTGDAREEHGDPLVRADGARRAEVEQAGEARRAGVVDVDARRLTGELVCTRERVLADDEWLSARLQHRLDDRKPVVRFVVEDPVRNGMRLVFPRPHELRAVPCGVFEPGFPGALEGALERPGRGGLHGVQPGRQPTFAQPRCDGARERPASDLDDGAVERDARRRQLPAERVAALDGEAVEVALARERHRPGRERLQQAAIRRVTRPAVTRATRDAGAERVEAGEHRGICTGGDEDAQRPAAGRGHDRGGQSGVATARDRELGAFCGQARPLARFQIDEDTEEVPSLVGSGHVAGFVLDPDSTRVREAEFVRQLVRACERRDHEAVAVNLGDARVELAHECAEVAVRQAELGGMEA